MRQPDRSSPIRSTSTMSSAFRRRAARATCARALCRRPARRREGYDILLRALAVAAPRLGTDWHLRIIGKGPRLAELLELRDALGLRERVTMLGWIDNPYPTMAAADVFVHPARFEPFGIVYIEALALGLPIVATACPGGPVEVLDHGKFGRLVPTDDPGALADAIVEVADDRRAPAGARGARPRPRGFVLACVGRPTDDQLRGRDLRPSTGSRTRVKGALGDE